MLRDGEVDLCPGRLNVDNADRLRQILRKASRAKRLSVEDQLWCVHLAAAVASCDVLLSLTEACLGETVGPAQTIPVVDMKREQHGGGASHASLRQAAEPPIRRWTAAAALRSVELENRDSVVGALYATRVCSSRFVDCNRKHG